MRFSVVLLPDAEEEGYTITVPQLPGCVSEADTLDEALAMARDAIEVHLGGFLDEGEELPEESAPAILLYVDVDIAKLAKAKPHRAVSRS